MSLMALSISSLGSEEHSLAGSEAPSNYTQNELYQQLRDIEELANNYYLRKPLPLTREHDAFAEVERGSSQEFEFQVSQLSQGDVVTLTVYCVPDIILEEEFITQKRKLRKGIDFSGLTFALNRQSTSNYIPREIQDINFQPQLFNGEYSFTLSTSHGLTTGKYVLTVSNSDDLYDMNGHSPDDPEQHLAVQSVRVSYKVYPVVRAIPIESNQRPLRGRVCAGEFAYYRFVSSVDTNMVVITTNPCKDTQGRLIGDADIYVTNRFNGLVGISDKENYAWVSTEVGSNRIEILPDDPNLSAPSSSAYMGSAGGGGNRTFIVGVLGNKEVNEFEIFVSESPPTPMLAIPITNHLGSDQHDDFCVDIKVLPDQYTFYSLAVDPSSRDQIICMVYSDPELLAAGNHLSRRYGRNLKKLVTDFEVIENYGRGVYTADTLATKGLLLSSASGNSRISMDNIESSRGLSSAGHDAEEQVIPIVYISSTVKYPDASNHAWRASGIDGTAVFILDSDEWKYTSGVCYFSIFGYRTSHPAVDTAIGHSSDNKKDNELLTKAKSKSKTGKLSTDEREAQHQQQHRRSRLTVWKHCELSYNQQDLQYCAHLFEDIYSQIDGNILSQRDRNKQGNANSMAGGGFAGGGGAGSAGNLAPSRRSRSDLHLSALGGGGSTSGAALERRGAAGGGAPVHPLTTYTRIGTGSAAQYTRSDAQLDETSLTYHEVEFVSFVEMLRDAGAVDGQIFCDLGCGVGKAMTAAALSGIRFVKCVGIEALPSLSQCCSDVMTSIVGAKENELLIGRSGSGGTLAGGLASGSNSSHALTRARSGSGDALHTLTYNSPAAAAAALSGSVDLSVSNNHRMTMGIASTSAGAAGGAGLGIAAMDLEEDINNVRGLYSIPDVRDRWVRVKHNHIPLMTVRHGNFLDVDWSDSDFVFACSLTYSERLMQQIMLKASKLKPGSKVVTLKLPADRFAYSRDFILEKSFWGRFTCGRAMVYVLKRKPVDADPVTSADSAGLQTAVAAAPSASALHPITSFS